MGQEGERLRLVVMGDSRVGKSSILKRFLYNNFQSKYQATVEDLYSKDFTLGHSTLKVDFLDTAGDDQFPVMRRLSISSGHAFLLVYSITSPHSLALVQTRLEEIKQQRNDFKEVPIVLAGSKADLGSEGREVHLEDVVDWVDTEYSENRINVLECSALNTYNITQVFRTFLVLAKIPLMLEKQEETDRLKRGNSATYGKGRGQGTGVKGDRNLISSNFASRLSLKLPSSPKFGGRFRLSRRDDSRLTTPSPLVSPLPSPIVSSDQSQNTSPGIPGKSPGWKDRGTSFYFPSSTLWEGVKSEDNTFHGAGPGISPSPSKPRSRSLIRRSSRKLKQKIKEAQEEEECTVS